MKKGFLLLTSLTLLLSLVSCGKKGSSPEDDIQTINIINVNDLHGALFEENGHKGMAQLKSDIDAIENEDDIKNTIVIGNGDMFQGTALSNMSYGEAVVNAMNACGFDVLGLGNHEFDWGIEKITQYFDGDPSNGESTAKFVNSNVYKDNKLIEHTVPYSVIDLGFVKVGVVSYAPKTLTNSILKSRVDGFEFKNLDFMKSVFDEVKAQSDVIVANTHWGRNDTDSVNLQLAGLGADAICDGHFHSEYRGMLLNGTKPQIPVVQTRDQLKSGFGLIRLQVKDREVVNSSVEIVPVGSKSGYKHDETVKAVIEAEYDKYKDQINEELCTVTGDQYKSQYADWGARVIQQNLDVEVALINSGAIRNVKVRNGDTIKYGDIYDIMPFDNEVWIYEMTGREIKGIGYSDSVWATRSGDYNPKYLDDDETYKIAIIDYVAFKFSSLKAMADNGQATCHTKIFRDMLVDEFRAHGQNNVLFNPKNPILTKK